MSTILRINTEAARNNPASVFARPMDVVSEPGLNTGQKLAALQRWAEGVRSRLAASSEGMRTPRGLSPQDLATLDEIGHAQAVLHGPPDAA